MENLLLDFEINNNRFTKNGRELQELLGSTSMHTDWAKRQIDRLMLEQDFDYQIVTERSHTNQPKQTYYFTVEAAYKVANRTEINSEGANMVKSNIEAKSIINAG